MSPVERLDTSEPFDAVILAGGAARRLGGVDKPGVQVAGRTLLQRVADAAGGARRLVVVGPWRPGPRARYVREDPPGGGPVPALRAGLAEVEARWFALLAADLPFLHARHLVALRRAAAHNPGGAVFLDAEGHPQWLVSLWKVGPLAAALDTYDGRSLRGLLAPLDPALLPARSPGDPTTFDCDTAQDVAEARAAAERGDGAG